MRRSEHRILTTHVGSLVRPPELRDLAAAAEKDAGKQAAYESALRRAIAAVVRQQVEVGIDIVNDGEFGKSSWSAYVLKRISGFEIRPDQLRPLIWLGRDRERFADFIAREMPRVIAGAPTEACVGPIEYQDKASIAGNIAMLQAALVSAKAGEGFLTAVAPGSTAYDGVNEYYATEEEYVYAIANALRHEYQAIYNSGLLVQVDDAVLANMYDHLIQSGPEKYRVWAQLRVEALNHALSGIPEERIRYHVCFGSWHVPHLADAPLESIIELILKVLHDMRPAVAIDVTLTLLLGRRQLLADARPVALAAMDVVVVDDGDYARLGQFEEAQGQDFMAGGAVALLSTPARRTGLSARPGRTSAPVPADGKRTGSGATRRKCLGLLGLQRQPAKQLGFEVLADFSRPSTGDAPRWAPDADKSAADGRRAGPGHAAAAGCPGIRASRGVAEPGQWRPRAAPGGRPDPATPRPLGQ